MQQIVGWYCEKPLSNVTKSMFPDKAKAARYASLQTCGESCRAFRGVDTAREFHRGDIGLDQADDPAQQRGLAAAAQQRRRLATNHGDYFGMGSMMRASSAKDASPALPLMRYAIFNCFTLPGAGSPPKLAL